MNTCLKPFTLQIVFVKVLYYYIIAPGLRNYQSKTKTYIIVYKIKEESLQRKINKK